MRLRPISLALLAVLAAACDPGYSPATASGLVYSDPPASAGWRLVRDPSSTSSRLVLGLVGPAGTLTRGAGLNVRTPAGLRFATFGGGALVEDGGVYELLSIEAVPAEPVALAGGVKDRNLLSAGAFQKDRRRSAKDSGATLLRFALELDPAVPPRAGTRLALEVERAAVVPADIGAAGDPAHLLVRKLVLEDVTVTAGKVEAR
jgi:hypothetical protein